MEYSKAKSIMRCKYLNSSRIGVIYRLLGEVVFMVGFIPVLFGRRYCGSRDVSYQVYLPGPVQCNSLYPWRQNSTTIDQRQCLSYPLKRHGID